MTECLDKIDELLTLSLKILPDFVKVCNFSNLAASFHLFLSSLLPIFLFIALRVTRFCSFASSKDKFNKSRSSL